jgi:hypothetical protein
VSTRLAGRSGRSKRVTQRKLEGSRPTRTKELSRCVESLVETSRVNGIVDSRVVPVGCAPDVGDIEEVEGFRDELESMRLLEVKRPGQARVKRVETMAKMGITTADGT